MTFVLKNEAKIFFEKLNTYFLYISNQSEKFNNIYWALLVNCSCSADKMNFVVNNNSPNNVFKDHHLRLFF
jgi:hypothetical protein